MVGLVDDTEYRGVTATTQYLLFPGTTDLAGDVLHYQMALSEKFRLTNSTRFFRGPIRKSDGFPSLSSALLLKSEADDLLEVYLYGPLILGRQGFFHESRCKRRGSHCC